MHSLGGRVILSALNYLANQNAQDIVKDVHLLGAFIDNKEYQNITKQNPIQGDNRKSTARAFKILPRSNMMFGIKVNRGP
jgi:uncharacterized protein DUF726